MHVGLSMCITRHRDGIAQARQTMFHCNVHGNRPPRETETGLCGFDWAERPAPETDKACRMEVSALRPALLLLPRQRSDGHLPAGGRRVSKCNALVRKVPVCTAINRLGVMCGPSVRGVRFGEFWPVGPECSVRKPTR
jgi:hypothetical protein